MKVTISSEEQLRTLAKIVDAQKDLLMGGTEFKDSHKECSELKALQKALAAVQSKQKLWRRGGPFRLRLARSVEIASPPGLDAV